MTTKGGGRQRIDYSEAEQMLRAGATQQEVADRFGVSQPAVNRAIFRGRIKDVGYDRTDTEESAIPWHPLRKEHRSNYLPRMLRAATRRARGLKNDPVKEAQLDNFLKQFEKEDFVVHYDPDTEQGWFRVPRRPGIDTGLIRDPYTADDGTPVPNPTGVYPRPPRAPAPSADSAPSDGQPTRTRIILHTCPRDERPQRQRPCSCEVVDGASLVLAAVDERGAMVRSWPVARAKALTGWEVVDVAD